LQHIEGLHHARHWAPGPGWGLIDRIVDVGAIAAGGVDVRWRFDLAL
jgi:hypothetical protein